MPKESIFDDFSVSETGNWNVADGYTKHKILGPMIRCEIYEDLATFGYESLAEELVSWYSVPDDVVRIKGFQRLVKELIKLCKNAKFAMTKSGTKKSLEDLENELKRIKKVTPVLYEVYVNQVRKTREFKIIPQKFDPVLERVLEIKSEINEPLNKNDMIFTHKEEFDPKAFKKALMERMVNKG